MISIYEKQYEVGNVSNFQQRVITSYESFDQYAEYLESDKSKDPYPSLPRQCKIVEFHKNGNALTLEFEHPVFRKNFIHTAILVNN